MPVSAEVRRIYYDVEAYFKYNHATGKQDKPEPKYRLFVREVVGLCVFFYLTTQNWTDTKKYMEILDDDWVWKKQGYLTGVSRIEMSDCCVLECSDLTKKWKNKKIQKTGVVTRHLMQRLLEAYHQGDFTRPGRPSSETVPVEFAFDQSDEVEKVAHKLGIA